MQFPRGAPLLDVPKLKEHARKAAAHLFP